ncbi:hypothetical protein ACFPOD_12130 [Nitratireductor kimnyeongensis]|uniref:Uncharacterized protein n=1 Tax=Nitratireductor kimnyeongensis TaxID=430679 RepID=A0ABW0TBH0_9HYPH|nr:hypothetical protein [Nitratireductor kimnyeongensis]QZZ35729.1 hypothetical protein KW403_00665 [Nitratireductor kimnyeongensis]
MTIDPETSRQIDELSLSNDPLLVLDVDDVVLEFIRPFPEYLRTRGFELKLENFGLNGNIVDLSSGDRATDKAVSQLVDAFFEVQHDWQKLAENASETIARLSKASQVVLLTAMPHRYRQTRRTLLDQLEMHYPLLTTERAKGPAIKRLRGDQLRPVAFVDDMYYNLVSVRDTVEDAHLFHLMADNSVRALMPPIPEGITVVEHWKEAGEKIARALNL